MSAAAWVLIGFTAGTIPSPWLIARIAGRQDVIDSMRRHDSPGDAHFVVSGMISKTAGVAAMVLDVVKGFVPALLAVQYDLEPRVIAAVGVAIVVGHAFAPFLRAAGGRGLSAAAGASLAIIPRAMTATGVIALIGTVTRRGGQGTGLGFALLPLFAWLTGSDGWRIAMACAIAALIGIRRLEGLGDDVRAGAPRARAIVGRLLFDLPGGRWSSR